MGDRFDVSQQPAQNAAGAFEREVVMQKVRAERKDDREPDEIDVEREKNNAKRERTLDRRGRSGWRGHR